MYAIPACANIAGAIVPALCNGSSISPRIFTDVKKQQPMNNLFRRYIVMGVVAVTVLLLICRFTWVQVVDDRFKLDAQNQAFLYLTDYPPRGNIYDRNGKLLVYNQVAYDLMVVPRNMQHCDTAELCRVLGISLAEFRSRLVRISGSLEGASVDYRSHIFESQVGPELNAKLQEKMYRFAGFYVQSRTVRKYSYPVAANLLGYIGEVNETHIRKDPYYRSGDYMGMSGIEKGYETFLRGRKGVQVKMRDVHNTIRGSYMNGKYDTAGVPGTDLTSTLDADLQLYSEQLMRTSLLVGRDFPKNYRSLVMDTLGKPLFNRALQAMYPPGCTFKLMNALIGQQEGVIDAHSRYSCSNGYPPLGGKPGCHHQGSLDLNEAIAHSCNSYFSYVFHDIVENKKYHGTTEEGYEARRNFVMSFGIGTKIGTDLPYELKGNIPTVKYYDNYFGKNGWNASTVISLGIGQGELLITPLQMANIMCRIANRGFFYTPHIVRSVGKEAPLKKWSEKHLTLVTERQYYENEIDGMSDVMTEGTARSSAIPGIELCGKTGTAQNPHGENHSLFVCFAPREHPKICVAVIVENSGQGAWWAAPIASLVVEKYLAGKISRPELEKHLLESDLVHSSLNSPKP
jgi:penicillin-binding protein 2